jgi:hypothetical protein
MAYFHAEIVSQFVSPDGKAKVDLLKRHDGFYEFVEYGQRILMSGPDEGEPYWPVGERSGLYETREEAERDALAAAKWLQRKSPN